MRYETAPKDGKWICVYSIYYGDASEIITYDEPWSFDIVGLTIDESNIDSMKNYFIKDDINDILKHASISKFENNGGLIALLGRKILSFRRELSFESGDLCVEFSVCVNKTEEEINKELDYKNNIDYQTYLRLKEKFEK